MVDIFENQFFCKDQITFVYAKVMSQSGMVFIMFFVIKTSYFLQWLYVKNCTYCFWLFGLERFQNPYAEDVIVDYE